MHKNMEKKVDDIIQRGYDIERSTTHFLFNAEDDQMIYRH